MNTITSFGRMPSTTQMPNFAGTRQAKASKVHTASADSVHFGNDDWRRPTHVFTQIHLSPSSDYEIKRILKEEGNEPLIHNDADMVRIITQGLGRLESETALPTRSAKQNIKEHLAFQVSRRLEDSRLPQYSEWPNPQETAEKIQTLCTRFNASPTQVVDAAIFMQDPWH